MTAYKLVVAQPFENYKRGDQITNQKLVKEICDEKSDLHHYERYVRRVVMSKAEMESHVGTISSHQAAIAPEKEPEKENVKKGTSLKIESIKDDSVN